jgi:hypothetical protein
MVKVCECHYTKKNNNKKRKSKSKKSPGPVIMKSHKKSPKRRVIKNNIVPSGHLIRKRRTSPKKKIIKKSPRPIIIKEQIIKEQPVKDKGPIIMPIIINTPVKKQSGNRKTRKTRIKRISKRKSKINRKSKTKRNPIVSDINSKITLLEDKLVKLCKKSQKKKIVYKKVYVSPKPSKSSGSPKGSPKISKNTSKTKTSAVNVSLPEKLMDLDDDLDLDEPSTSISGLSNIKDLFGYKDSDDESDGYGTPEHDSNLDLSSKSLDDITTEALEKSKEIDQKRDKLLKEKISKESEPEQLFKATPVKHKESEPSEDSDSDEDTDDSDDDNPDTPKVIEEPVPIKKKTAKPSINDDIIHAYKAELAKELEAQKKQLEDEKKKQEQQRRLPMRRPTGPFDPTALLTAEYIDNDVPNYYFPNYNQTTYNRPIVPPVPQAQTAINPLANLPNPLTTWLGLPKPTTTDDKNNDNIEKMVKRIVKEKLNEKLSVGDDKKARKKKRNNTANSSIVVNTSRRKNNYYDSDSDSCCSDSDSDSDSESSDSDSDSE